MLIHRVLSCAPALYMALLAAATVGDARAQTGELVVRTELRVCADPRNLPFSDDKKEGFENKIADLMAHELSLPVRYVWFPQIIGFVRNTLRAGLCDLVMGTVAGDEVMQTTTPYYYTSYVMIYRTDKGLPVSGLEDPEAKRLHIGVVSGTPPADLLVHYGLMANAKPYPLTIDTRYESPGHQMVLDVANGTIDAGLLWGPIAGYYIRHDKLPLEMRLLKSEPGMPRMAYHISMGLRGNEPEWRRRINTAIRKNETAIIAILKDYGVPLLDEQGHALKP